MTEFVFVTQPANLYFFSRYYLWTPDSVVEELFWHCETFCRLFSLPLLSSRWEKINTNSETEGYWVDCSPGSLISLCTTLQGISSCPNFHITIHQPQGTWQHHFYSLGKKGVGCHSVNIDGSQQRDTRTAQQCLHLGTTWWGYETVVSRWGQHGHQVTYLHIFPLVLDISKVASVDITAQDIQMMLFRYAKTALKKIISTSLVKLLCQKVLTWLLSCWPRNELPPFFLILIMGEGH